MSASSTMFRNTYLKNIKECYENKDKNSLDLSHPFDKATYDLYIMLLDKKPESVIDGQITYINSLDVPYWKIRCMFG